MITVITIYYKGYLSYSKTKVLKIAIAGFLKLLPLLYALWREISIDYIGLFPKLKRGGRDIEYEYVLVIINRLIKMRYYIGCEGLITEELVEKFIDRIYILYGLPDTIVSDRGV